MPVKKDAIGTEKGTIAYTNEGSGNKINKVVTEKGVTVNYLRTNYTTGIITTTSYLTGAIYESKGYIHGRLTALDYVDKLQFFQQEDGRIRLEQPSGASAILDPHSRAS